MTASCQSPGHWAIPECPFQSLGRWHRIGVLRGGGLLLCADGAEGTLERVTTDVFGYVAGHAVATASEPGSLDRANEDLVLVGADSVVVLDGATVRTDTGCVHGVSWYVAQLGQAILDAILDQGRDGLSGALAAAIAEVARRHGATCGLDHPGTPSAAVAILRVSDAGIDYLVLGDTTIVLDAPSGLTVITDDRVSHTAVPERAAADRHLIGTPEKNDALLAMKHAELAARNRLGGYWIAAADPTVVEHALTGHLPTAAVQRAAMVTDGAARAVDPFGLLSWPQVLDLFAVDGPAELIARVRAAESGDRLGVRWPRNKTSDDATAVYVALSE